MGVAGTMRGRFITFEGGEGLGKTLQVSALISFLQEVNIPVLGTREPGGTPGAECARNLLKKGAIGKIGSFAEAIVLSAARSDHLTCTIRPALEKGIWVVCDRFIDSTHAYQGKGCSISSEILFNLEKILVRETYPDLTFMLDAPVELAAERIKTRAILKGDHDWFEQEIHSFHEKVRLAFLSRAQESKERCVLVNADQSPDDISRAIRQIVANRFELKE